MGNMVFGQITENLCHFESERKGNQERFLEVS